MRKFDYDLFVIGGGSGGVRSARLAAGLGVRTAIAEEYRFGGTCVIRGCVPKKLFVYASEFGRAIDDARAYGWSVGEKRFDWKTLVANKDAEIARISKVYSDGVEAAGGTVIHSRAVVMDPHTVRIVGEGRTVTAERILIATGGHPFIPDIPGKELAITSNEAFHLEELPRKIVIVGAGYIAVEFAGIFYGLGVEVELLYRGGEILRGFDHDLRDRLTVNMKAQGIAITCNTEPAAIETTRTGLMVVTNRDARIACDAVMFATGRRPNTVGLGLQKLGVQCGWNGRIMVNDFYQNNFGATAVPADPAQQHIVVVDPHAEPIPEPVDRLFEVRVVERGQCAAHLADHVVVVMAVRSGRLVTGLGPAEIQALDQPVLGERIEGAVDARTPDAPSPLTQRTLDVMRADGARLGRKQVDDLVPRPAATMARVLEHRARVHTPAGIVDRHTGTP